MRTPVATGLAVIAALLSGACRTPETPEPTRDQPNILVIVADDLGYSDLGVYGGEIPTPNLDALAASGTFATDFYVSSWGEPTRAMLLTGVDNHVAGFGASSRRLLPTQEGKPGYEGRLRPNVVTVSTLLGGAGYHTCMAGKWEIGSGPLNRPASRGFERSFALHDSSASHWSDMKSGVPGRDRAHFTENGRDVTKLPEDYFSTRFFTDFIAECIEDNRADGRPFFAYLAFQAPHGPLAAPDEWRDRFAGRYAEGFDAIREARLLRMKQRKIVHPEVRPFPGIPTVPMWKDLSDEQKREQARKMEIYAAMVANLDFHVGRLLNYLRAIGEYHETLVVFLSDNGAEPGDRGPDGMDPRNRDWYAQQFPERGMEYWGRPGSFIEYGPAWAQVGTVPFQLFKGTLAEGGIRAPLVVSGPGVKRKRVTRALLHVADLAPTFLERAGVSPEETVGDRWVAAIEGRSLAPLLSGARDARRGPHSWLGFAFSGDMAVRRDHWKLVRMPPPFGTGQWRLHRIDLDPSELYDRSERQPDVREELIGLWRLYAARNGVVVGSESEPLDGR